MTVNNNPAHPNAAQPSSQPLDGVNGRAATPTEIAQQEGYVRGRSDEFRQSNLRAQERAVAQAQANGSAASGVVFGLILALLAGGIGAAVYFLSGDRTAPTVIPQVERETIERETTIIEQDSPAPEVSLPDVEVPDVQVNVPPVEVPAAPDVNIPNQEPAAAPESPEVEPAEAAPEAVSEPAN
jgi:hypothetical protein